MIPDFVCEAVLTALIGLGAVRGGGEGGSSGGKEIIALSPDGKFLFTGGHADFSVKLATAPFPSSPIAGVTAGLVAVGAWAGGRLARPSTAAPTGPHDPALAAAAAAESAKCGGGYGAGGLEAPRKWRRMEGPVQVLRGHLDTITCCAVSSDLELVASSSCSHGVLVHFLMMERFMRQLPRVGSADLLAISPEGVVVVWERQQRALRAFTINGAAVAGVGISEEHGDVSSVQVSSNGLFVAVGTDCSRWRHVQEKEGQREREHAAVIAGRPAATTAAAAARATAAAGGGAAGSAGGAAGAGGAGG
ncbi:unnamed protein product [Closterium sp. Naga37s-1]|nr:unnamed protein product [Closterium sp. Naga37s-1]